MTHCWKESQTIAQEIIKQQNSGKFTEKQKNQLIEKFEKENNLIYLPKLDILINNAASGDPAKGTNNLVVTTQDVPKVGDVVTAKGTLHKDKDFGAGYKYQVIVEEATVKP